jgi:endonuclease/exonuclease/phosphatase family metal-dependent hydrolase
MRKIATAILCFLLLVPGLFLANGLLLARGTVPRSGHVVSSMHIDASASNEVRVMAFNIAKCFVYVGGGRLAPSGQVRDRLDEIARIVRGEQPDVLFLSEIAWEAGWGGVNQVTYLAEHTGMTNWAFGENFCFGFPGHRVVSGNAILTRKPTLKALANPDLPGRRPFYITRNNRRALVAKAVLGGEPIRLYSLHNDSFVPTNNLAQMEWLLADARGHRSIMAGDFNETPRSPSLRQLAKSGMFAGVAEGPPTIPNVSPDRTIDYIFGPAGWHVLRHSVITNSVSDHCAVFTVFEVMFRL